MYPSKSASIGSAMSASYTACCDSSGPNERSKEKARRASPDWTEQEPVGRDDGRALAAPRRPAAHGDCGAFFFEDIAASRRGPRRGESGRGGRPRKSTFRLSVCGRELVRAPSCGAPSRDAPAGAAAAQARLHGLNRPGTACTPTCADLRRRAPVLPAAAAQAHLHGLAMQRSAAAAQVPELPRELVVAIARAAKDGITLATMLQVCRAWRVALNAEIASLLPRRSRAVPRLHGILAAAEAQSPCFRTLYRNRLEADDKFGPVQIILQTQNSPSMSTAELSWATEWRLVAASRSPAQPGTRRLYRGCRNSIRLDRAFTQLGSRLRRMIVLTKEAAYDALIPSTAAAEISIAAPHNVRHAGV